MRIIRPVPRHQPDVDTDHDSVKLLTPTGMRRTLIKRTETLDERCRATAICLREEYP